MNNPSQQNPFAFRIEPASPDGALLPANLDGRLGTPSWDTVLLAQAGGHGAAQPGHDQPLESPGAHGGEAGGHDAGPAHYMMPHEMPNLATLIEFATVHKHAEPHHGVRPHPSTAWFINPAFSIFYALVFVWIVRRALRRPSIERPGRLQMAVETVLGGLMNFFVGIIGKENRKFVPFLGTLWIFIWMNNIAVLIPGLKSPSSSFKTTVALGICTFCYVQFNAIKYSGFKGWIYHLLGSPTDLVTWLLSPLFLFLEVVGELVKPVSLSLRLFGNIFGEDKLLASFLGMGMLLVAALANTSHPIVGVPLQLPFYFLVVLLSTIQATVFSLLASIYIILLLPHEHHEEGHETMHAEDAADHRHDSVAAAAQV